MFSYDALALSSAAALSPALVQLVAHLHATNPTLFPAAVLPEQFSPTVAMLPPHSGVVDLMRAVLADALQCFRQQKGGRDRHQARLAQEANAWFFSEDERWPFAFLNVCHALGLDPEAIRRALRPSQALSTKEPPKMKRMVTHRRRPLHWAA